MKGMEGSGQQIGVKGLAFNPGLPFQNLSHSFREKSDFFSKAKRQNPERKAWVEGYGSIATLHASTFGMQAHFQLYWLITLHHS